MSFVQTMMVTLPERPNPKPLTLFLDLDETLIHSCGENQNPENIVSIREGNIEEKMGLNVRPYCHEFL